IGVLGSGISYAYVKEAVALLGVDVEVLKLGTVHPLPKDLITTFITGKRKVVIVEEMEPVVEEQVKALAYELGLNVDIHGKDVIPRVGELTTTRVKAGLARALSLPPDEPVETEGLALPPRPPTLCPGCPHRATFYCINKVAKKSIKTSDIGCYTLGVVAPLSAVDTTLCMGASIGVACGLAAAGNKGVFATIGDSTFFHTGIPPLIDAVYNGHDINVVVLDNRTTAMTGHQPHPGTGWTATRREAPKIDIAELCTSIGAYTQVVDPQDLDDTVEAMKRARDHEGVSVIVAKRPCALLVGPLERDAEHFEVDTEICNGCKVCIKQLGCPALLFDEESKKAEIDTLLCTGCGVCAQVCPFNAITSM
ncbi:indolepyruvate ferredoxin oxidoreductase subunit alpha, partial [archaeon]